MDPFSPEADSQIQLGTDSAAAASSTVFLESLKLSPAAVIFISVTIKDKADMERTFVILNTVGGDTGLAYVVSIRNNGGIGSESKCLVWDDKMDHWSDDQERVRTTALPYYDLLFDND